MVISPDTSIPTLFFKQFSLSSTVHSVSVEDCPLCPVLSGIVAIMLDMVMEVMDMDMVLTMVMSSVMVVRTVTYNCSLNLHLQRITVRRQPVSGVSSRWIKLQFEKSTTILVKSRRAPINNLIILYPSIKTPLSHNLIDRQC